MITEAKRTGRHTWRGGVGRDRAQRAQRLKQREEEPAKDTENEHRGRKAGGRTGEKGRGGGSFTKQEMVYKVRCHGEVREGGALKSPLHLAIRRSFGGRGESNFKEVLMRGNT